MKGELWAKIPQGLILDESVTAQAKVLYGRLYHYAFVHQKWHKPWPTQAQVAEDLTAGVSTIGRLLHQLQNAGWVTVHRVKNGQRWDRIELHSAPNSGRICAQKRVQPEPLLSDPVLSDMSASQTPSALKSGRTEVGESEVQPAETAPETRIYSVPAPKNEGQGLIPPDSASDTGASAVAEGTPRDGVPEAGAVASASELLHQYRQRVQQRDSGPGAASFWGGEDTDLYEPEPSFAELVAYQDAA